MIEVDAVAAKYWPRWRGPSGQGQVPDGPYPDRWSASQNIVWRAPVAGRGNSSPIVWGDRIFLTTAQDGGQRLSLVCFRRSDGKQLWEAFAPQSGFERGHPKNGHASATPVTDGRARLRLLRQPRAAGRRLRRKDRLASPGRPHRQLSRQRRVAGLVQGPPLHLSGSRRQRGGWLVRRRLRHGDRQGRCGGRRATPGSGGARRS